MTSLNEYLVEKRAALAARKARIEDGSLVAVPLSATVSVEGRSGVRRIRIRDHQVVTDSPPDFAGYDLGPGSPELQLGILGSCLAHSYLIQAARLGVPLDAVEVAVNGQIDARAGQPGFEAVPVAPHDLAYTVRIVSPAAPEALAGLQAEVDRACPILNLLRAPQAVHGTVEHRRPAASDPTPAAQARAA
ncbi:OsmC family protein [Methylobacterium tarhaniae]|uniref:OsmC family protein n=1 Tax=Methylobacterium tarhaniae TaxID=1187852 RepID=A0A0J6SRG9_9HYPH|nr:OsmC family protein [Methylobacterium tarhaniae]KMO36172.1 OsmC family protein [Methylobacterium tarhaniae]